MPSFLSIRSKIAVVQNTQKITRAMEMISASKMRAATAKQASSGPYVAGIANLLGHLLQSEAAASLNLLKKREVKTVGILVIGSNRGLCGGLNNNLFRAVLRAYQSFHQQQIEVKWIFVGHKTAQFFENLGIHSAVALERLGDKPSLSDCLPFIQPLWQSYVLGHIDELWVGYNAFVNAMIQKPVVQAIFPQPPEAFSSTLSQSYAWDYIYEPSAAALIPGLLERYVEALLYQAILENIACEHSARMIAMRAASDNAGNFIRELTLSYNKLRQSSITQELIEIVTGANAV